MSSVIEILHQEHRNIAHLLNAMEGQVEFLATASETDFELLKSISDYFCDYPNSCHHPKENAILQRIKARYPSEAAFVSNLEKEHSNARERASRLRDTVQSIYQDQLVPRDKLVRAARSFIEAEREHMKMEENLFFPLAVSTLDEGDWKIIEGNIRQTQDPMFGDLVEKEFANQREFLLRWSREAALS